MISGLRYPLRKPPFWGNIKQEATMTDEAAIEAAIQAKGLNAPRMTPDAIDAQIVDEAYYNFPGTTLTVCCLTLVNGFNVTGESAAVSLENFDEEIGREIARKNARERIWSFEGYRLKQSLHDAALASMNVAGE